VTTRGGQTNSTERHQGALELQRLITSGGSGDDWAVELLKAAAPHENAAGRKQRILMSLAYPAEKQRGSLLLRRMVVAGIVVVFGCGTAIASAALGHWPKWAARAYETLIGAPEASGPAHAGATLPGRHGRRVGNHDGDGTATGTGIVNPDVGAQTGAMAEAAAPVEPGAVVSSSVTVSPTWRAPRRGAASSMRGPRHALSARSVAGSAATSVALPREDAGPVLAAMRALRRDHDPVRARELLDAYMTGHPSGGLVEEALAISIEAAAVHHDPDAGDLADRYLRLYPTGPFHRLAERTRAGVVPR
jgi:hypothetical protein